jgi:hypothetical protein
MEHPYINVVCGSQADLARYWTAGVPNVAITASLNDDMSKHVENTRRQWEEEGAEDPVDVYRRYALVGCLTEADAVALRAEGVVAKHLQPMEFAAALKDIDAKGP